MRDFCLCSLPLLSASFPSVMILLCPPLFDALRAVFPACSRRIRQRSAAHLAYAHFFPSPIMYCSPYRLRSHSQHVTFSRRAGISLSLLPFLRSSMTHGVHSATTFSSAILRPPKQAALRPFHFLLPQKRAFLPLPFYRNPSISQTRMRFYPTHAPHAASMRFPRTGQLQRLPDL